MSRTQGLVLNTPVDSIAWSDVLNYLNIWGAAHQSKIVCICNVHMVVAAKYDELLAKVLNAADLVTPDGAPVAWVLRRGGFLDQQRINGPDLMWRYLGEAERNRHVVSFFGGQEEVLSRLKSRIGMEFPDLIIGQAISPPFREATTEEDQCFIEKINSSGTAVLFVGLGCPKQEKWMLAHKGKINAVMVGVGAAFDYHAETIRRAPLWMQRNGLEWFHRLCSEPRRLWKRYLITNTLFILNMVKTGFRAKRVEL